MPVRTDTPASPGSVATEGVRLRHVDALRAIAALLVVCLHVTQSYARIGADGQTPGRWMAELAQGVVLRDLEEPRLSKRRADQVAAKVEHAAVQLLDDGEALTSLHGQGGTGGHAATQWPAPDERQRTGWLARLMAGRNLVPQHTCLVRIGAVQQPSWQPLEGVPLGAAWQAADAPDEAAGA